MVEQLLAGIDSCSTDHAVHILMSIKKEENPFQFIYNDIFTHMILCR